jgi:hypothetical protein
MGLYQSFPQVFVTNSPALLAQGKTVDSLAIGQIGVLDAKTYLAVTAPTYAKNKALKAVWGTPNISNGDFFGAPNENEYSKLIKGKLIKSFRAKAAQRGQTPVYTLGWSGDVSDTDTLSAKTGEIKTLWVKLSGSVIDRLYSTQGVTKQIVLEGPCVDNCTFTCESIPCPDMAEQIVKAVSSDKDLKKFIRAKSLISCTPALTPPVETTCYKFMLTVCDTGDAAALGIVSAQFPDENIVLVSRSGALSTYGVVKDANVAPAAYTQTGVFVPDCATCPADYTLIPEAKTFQVKTQTGVLNAAVALAFAAETSITLVNSDPQFNTYLVTFPVATSSATVLAAAGVAGYIAIELGVQQNICQQTVPTSIAWSADGTLNKQARSFRITLLDSVCGTDRLADVQAAYPNLVVSLVSALGDCVHTYETSVVSNCYEVGCGVENIVFVAPASFENAQWIEVVPAVVDPAPACKCGVIFETAFFHTPTGECSFDAFPYENDVVHIQISQYNPDFNADPCEADWVVKQIRGVKYPQGHGQYIRKREQESKMYDLRHRSTDAVVRELEGYSLQADPTKFYDEYVLEFDTVWFTAGGWSEKYSQSFSLFFYVPEGQGGQIETLFNSYLTSAGIEEDGAVI